MTLDRLLVQDEKTVSDEVGSVATEIMLKERKRAIDGGRENLFSI